MIPEVRRRSARARAGLAAEVRRTLAALGYEEVETPCLVRAPGMEPHIQAFETELVPESGGTPTPLFLHTSPEYAMKRLLAGGFERVFQLARVFRNGELSATHNPEFTMLEMYRAEAGYGAMMEDVERLVEACARALVPGGSARPRRGGVEIDLSAPFERLTVAEAFRRHAGVDLAACAGDAASLAEAARRAGIDPGPPGEPFDDVFFRVMLERIEPRIGVGRPTYLVDWPAPMAALSRVKPDDPLWAERFELYAAGLEIANGFGELTDREEQRRRLVEEQAQRRRLGRREYPIDEAFLDAVARMPEASGVALGFDRLLMLLTGAERIEDVLLFPAAEMA